jgi:hypothetical protein
MQKGDIGRVAKINQGMRQGCPLSPTLFNIYTVKPVRQWQNNLTKHFQINQNVIDTVLFADDQAVIAKTEHIQQALHKLTLICTEYNHKISTVKTKVMVFIGREHFTAKIMTNKVTEQVKEFNYLGCSVSYISNNDTHKSQKFQYLWDNTAYF